jgi:lipoic acid synthetase
MSQSVNQRSERAMSKLSKIPVKIDNSNQEKLAKPDWIRTRLPIGPQAEKARKLTELLKSQALVTVCHEAACPNLPECYSHGTATFMIMGDLCTRRCSFCDVAHGRPQALDPDEPKKLAQTTKAMGLRYVVITSVDRDDLRDGGAQHFVDCIKETRAACPEIKIEILVPDFRGRLEKALNILGTAPPDVLNHNIETVSELYLVARPGSDYQHSLTLLQQFKF